MNIVILSGRLTKDAEGGEKLTAFTLAVDGYKDKTDFIRVKCFGKTAEFAGRHLKKGMKTSLEGVISTGSYEKDGRTVYTMDIIANRLEPQWEARTQEPRDTYSIKWEPKTAAPKKQDVFTLDDDDDDLPF
jgi:single-strand DNA-binding protein